VQWQRSGYTSSPRSSESRARPSWPSSTKWASSSGRRPPRSRRRSFADLRKHSEDPRRSRPTGRRPRRRSRARGSRRPSRPHPSPNSRRSPSRRSSRRLSQRSRRRRPRRRRVPTFRRCPRRPSPLRSRLRASRRRVRPRRVRRPARPARPVRPVPPVPPREAPGRVPVRVRRRVRVRVSRAPSRVRVPVVPAALRAPRHPGSVPAAVRGRATTRSPRPTPVWARPSRARVPVLAVPPLPVVPGSAAIVRRARAVTVRVVLVATAEPVLRRVRPRAVPALPAPAVLVRTPAACRRGQEARVPAR
jgi:hypothetical protein